MAAEVLAGDHLAEGMFLKKWRGGGIRLGLMCSEMSIRIAGEWEVGSNGGV